MSASFQCTINVDIRDSEPDWAPFESLRVPEGAPNVITEMAIGFPTACGTIPPENGTLSTDL